eukprot:s1476_g5.t1
MEIHIQIKTVQKPEDVITAFAALGQGQSSAARNRPPIQRTRREAMATTEAARRSPSPILSQRELEALQKEHYAAAYVKIPTEIGFKNAKIGFKNTEEERFKGTFQKSTYSTIETRSKEGNLQIPYTSSNIQISYTSGNLQISCTPGNI